MNFYPSETATDAEMAASEAMTMDDYLLNHISPEDDYLHRLYRATNTHLLRPRMASGHLQGQLLRMLTGMIRPKVVVEIGTYSGYSALSMAAGMTADAVLHTFEINDEQEVFTRPWLEGSPYPPRIVLHIGEVEKLLPPMNLSIDLAFIDANKRQYVYGQKSAEDRAAAAGKPAGQRGAAVPCAVPDAGPRSAGKPADGTHRQGLCTGVPE